MQISLIINELIVVLGCFKALKTRFFRFAWGVGRKFCK